MLEHRHGTNVDKAPANDRPTAVIVRPVEGVKLKNIFKKKDITHELARAVPFKAFEEQ